MKKTIAALAVGIATLGYGVTFQPSEVVITNTNTVARITAAVQGMLPGTNTVKARVDVYLNGKIREAIKDLVFEYEEGLIRSAYEQGTISNQNNKVTW